MYTLITGASSGIGKALALECASRGMDLLLVALPGTELADLEKEIMGKYRVHCHSFPVDLSQRCASTQVYDWVKANDYKVNVLINNVGVGSKGPFEKISKDFYYTQINLNITAMCIMTRLFSEELKANAPSHILNLGSLGGFFILPEKTVYTATKAFVYSFSQSLRSELKPQGITVSVVCPGGIDSNANTIASNKDLKGLAKASILTTEEVARKAIGSMLKGRSVIIPGYVNKFNYGLSRIVPKFIQNIFIGRAFKNVKKHSYS